MAKKQSTPQPATPRAPAQNTPSKPAPPPSSTKQTTAPASNTPKITSTTLSQRSSPQEIAIHVWNKYVQDTPSRTLLLDCFLLYIALNGAVQFIYCIIGGNYPFNAFLSGFGAAVGQFVLTISLRMQTTELPPAGSTAQIRPTTTMKTIDASTGKVVEDSSMGQINSERAFADFVFGSLILHAFCVNFIN